MGFITNSFRVRQRLRPIRLAFLVHPGDTAALKRVVQVNSCLWGGMYNGIVPIHRRLPKTWTDQNGPKLSPLQVQRGYLDAFEPDFVVEVGEGLCKELGVPRDRTIQLEDVIRSQRTQDVGYGLSTIEIYNELYQKDFKFVRRSEMEVYILKSQSPSLSLLEGACLGQFPDFGDLGYFEKAYRRRLGAVDLTVNGGNLIDLAMNHNRGTPLRIGAAFLDKLNPNWSLGPYLYYLDGTDNGDIIDFWNLRALGMDVLPVPKQYAPDLIASCRQIVELNHVPRGYNREILGATTLIKARSVTQDEVDEYARKISEGQRGALHVQGWYPRLWTHFGRKHDNVLRCELVANGSQSRIKLAQGSIEFALLRPEFLDRNQHYYLPVWATVVDIWGDSLGIDSGLVSIPGIGNVSRVLGHHFSQVIASSEGLIVLCEGNSSQLEWKIPDGFSWTKHWFDQLGISASLSSAGRIATQLVASLNGLSAVSVIAQREILQLLDRMSHGLVETENTESDAVQGKKPVVRGRIVSRDQWIQTLGKVHKGKPMRVQRHLDNLLKYGVLKLGLRVACPTCTQANWYPLDGLSETLSCERCLSTFPFPVASPPDKAWYYRTQGPFSVENYAQGSYVVALSLMCLVDQLNAHSVWVPGIEIADSTGKRHEIDLLAWWKEFLSQEKPRLILGECKSFNKFETKDFHRAKVLADLFPGSVLVFATLRDKLSDSERSYLSKVALSGRVPTNDDWWRLPIIVLTAKELLTDEAIPGCWSGQASHFEEAYRKSGEHPLLKIADLTQQLHLGLAPYHQWLDEYLRTGGQRKMEASSASN